MSSSPKRSKKTKKSAARKPVVKETCPSFCRGHLSSKDNVERLRLLSKPHVESFDYFLEQGLKAGIADIVPSEIDIVDPKKEDDSNTADLDTVQFWIEKVEIQFPSKSDKQAGGKKLCPRECRELGLVYDGQMTGEFCWEVIQHRNGVRIPSGRVNRVQRPFGAMPIMVLSKKCHLHGKSPKELVAMREEQNEFGGYFIVSGIERCVRMLQIPRRNHAMAIQRSSYKARGPTYTDLGVAIRCSRHCGDQSSITNTVHYLTTGGVMLKFVAKKQEFLVPVILILRSLSGDESETASADMAAGGGRIGITDEELYRRIVQDDKANTFLRARAELLLQDARTRYGNLNTPEECLAYIGSRFRNLSQRAQSTSNVEVGHFMLKRYVLIHLQNYKDKLECLLLLLRKLYSFAAGDCGQDNADSLQNQEVLLPGHLMSCFVKEKFEESLAAVRVSLIREMRQDFEKVTAGLQDKKFWTRLIDRNSGAPSGGIGKKVQTFLSTGNIISSTGLDLMQVSGFTIVAEKLNFLRYCSHFRSIHRGQFFLQMKTTSVRKLLPDQWGFLCPVHTPDGGPCGLLSHLALECSALACPEDSKCDLDDLLISLGVSPLGAGGRSGDGRAASTHAHLPVCLDGRVVGGATASMCKSIANHLRTLKVADNEKVPRHLEVALIPAGARGGPYPGLYLFTGAARLVRPVIHRSSGRTEMIGPMEQPFMDIACLDEDVREGVTTHQELDSTNMLSLIASLTPFSDYNQSPRNMYQCQMGKQTMGTPCHALPYRTDNKMYKLQNPQAPVVQTKRHGEFKMDEYPNGTNAIVAVLSYTGFDMEDAMILNKGSFQRGFGHASVYKTMQVDLDEEAKRMGTSQNGENPRLRFANKKGRNGELVHQSLGEDGLPEVGSAVDDDDPLYCIVDELSGKDKVGKHHESERAYVQTIRGLGSGDGKKVGNKVSITLRYPRNPVIGDKFSSRHGQKGVLSIVWPQEDMPFSESGISPDVIINPHAFPSRMTIGMLIESMAGKSGALHGNFQDATPFSFHESGDKIAVDYFGEQLQLAGYNYYGSEPLYSGVSGCLMHADLYIGVVYYQRLRHMVSDKYQVRATGPTSQLTRQPIKGRKKGGGIRLGEMERDSLLSHGAAYLLHDRLLNCSDKHVAYACTRCGDLLSPTTERSSVLSTGQSASDIVHKARLRYYCRNPKCKDAVQREGSSDESIEPIILPYVYRYLANELAGMNIKMTLDIK